jgi:hypothetical protein
MRGLALFLVAAMVGVAGCDSGSHTGGTVPAVAHVKTEKSSQTGTSVAVAADAPLTPKSLCVPEGKPRPKNACVAGLKRLANGKARNPAAACMGLAKKKTKGTKGRSPFAVCVTAAAKLMAAKNHLAKNGAADNSNDNSSADDNSDSMTCFDVDGNEVSPDDPNVDGCTDASDNSGSDDSTSADDSSSDSSDSTDTTSTDDSTDSNP